MSTNWNKSKLKPNEKWKQIYFKKLSLWCQVFSIAATIRQRNVSSRTLNGSVVYFSVINLNVSVKINEIKSFKSGNIFFCGFCGNEQHWINIFRKTVLLNVPLSRESRKEDSVRHMQGYLKLLLIFCLWLFVVFHQ